MEGTNARSVRKVATKYQVLKGRYLKSQCSGEECGHLSAGDEFAGAEVVTAMTAERDASGGKAIDLVDELMAYNVTEARIGSCG